MKLQHKATYQVVILMSIFVLLFKFLHAKYDFDWRFAAAFSYGMYFIFVVWSLFTKNTVLFKILLFGICAGLVELISDWWLVDIEQSLVYPLDEPMLWASPLYMPFSWAVIFVQIGVASLFVFEKWGIKKAVIVSIVLGALFVPFFEYWAKVEGWWYYQNCKMILDAVPYYIILSEALICATLPLWFTRIEKFNYLRVILAGSAQGLWIWLMAMLAFYIIR